MTKNTTSLFLAPLQGFTDAIFRQAWQQNFVGLDRYYAPYIALQNDGTVRNSQFRDLLPERNDILPVPQILPANAQEALELTQKIEALGVYKEININVGCPYPMVTNRGRGSGLLPYPERLDDILSVLFKAYGSSFSFSLKMRCGLESFEEIESLMPVINKYPIRDLILHPRIAKQLYKGEADHALFEKAMTLTDLPLYYNGDIFSLSDYQLLMDEFPQLSGVMLGRGVLQNPLLPLEIKRGEVFMLKERLELLKPFVDEIFDLNSQHLSGESHLLSKMKSYVPYFASFNSENRPAYKKMKKAKSLRSYREGMNDLLKLK